MIETDTALPASAPVAAPIVDAPLVIALVNYARTQFPTPLATLAAALQIQFTRDFCPAWGFLPSQFIVAEAGKVPPNAWQLGFFDTADQAGALGYHDLTTGGQPFSKIFVRTTLEAGEKVEVTASHEAVEMRADPGCALYVYDAGSNTWWALETADAVEEDEYEIDIDGRGVPVSNFLTPAYFEAWRLPGTARFDFLGKLSGPFTLDAGGYSTVVKDAQPQQVFGSPAKEARFALEDRRYHRSEYRAWGSGHRLKALYTLPAHPPVKTLARAPA